MAEAIVLGGVTDVIAALAELEKRADAPGAARKRSGEAILREANPRVPRRTGRLASSGRVEPASGNVLYGSGSVPYANPIHWGWRDHSIEPQPWLQKTAEAEVTHEKVVRIWAQELQALIESLGG